MNSADPITLEALRFFARSAGRQLLEEATALADDEWRAQEEVRRRLRIDTGTADTTLILTRLADRPVCLICEKVEQ